MNKLIDKIFLPLLLLGFVLLTGIMFFPEMIASPKKNEKIVINITKDNTIEIQSANTAIKDEKLKKTSTNLDSTNYNKPKDKNLVFVKESGVDPSIITNQESYTDEKNDMRQITKVQMNYGQFKLLENEDINTNIPLKKYSKYDMNFYFTDYLYKEAIEPLMNQLEAWQEANNRPIQMLWTFTYEKRTHKYPIYMNLQIYSPQESDDINIPLNLNLMLYNKAKTEKIDYKENKFIRY